MKKNDPALSTSVEALRRAINDQKVELASRNLRITGLEETLRKTRENLANLSQSDDDVFASMVRRIDWILPSSTKAFYGAECPSYPNCSGGCGLGCTHKIEAARRADDEAGMAWWNGLTDQGRAKWAEDAGNTGRAKDAWEAFKRSRADGATEKAVP
jgi:hypothetical protein